jgi:hypothetical protein
MYGSNLKEQETQCNQKGLEMRSVESYRRVYVPELVWVPFTSMKIEKLGGRKKKEELELEEAEDT